MILDTWCRLGPSKRRSTVHWLLCTLVAQDTSFARPSLESLMGMGHFSINFFLHLPSPRIPRPPAPAITAGKTDVPRVAAVKMRAAPPDTIGNTTKIAKSNSIY